MKRVTLATLRELKRAGEKIACLTAYDYSFAALLERAGVDLIMVGDSLGMVVQGHDTTLPVSLAEMVYHSRCVARGVQRALLVADMPFMSYQASPEQALASAGRLMRRGGAQVVKLEGGAPMVETVRFLVARGVPVCAHLGLTPQSVHKLGGYRVQGRDTDDAERIRRDARALEEAGAGLLVLEAVPAALARTITRELSIPTIGIGAGPDCDGQILVLHDMLGIYPKPPKFSKNFMDGAASIEDAVKNYVAAVKSRAFPGPEHSY
ncbi:MAG: 3-methyl-2-oxobutanoate hydroxymethyltransferase [Candidatus Muproteobacteria bacterium RBG_16_65_31]|uniref:3-methyl-2-oxobutanoate hydroxymethyltransferase n=1 Tax=Candidatus Muproteobacteria bacterium RBG_16_65_31 TaxID=1817759 RepID=A0A1F6TD61_9PROT|nr:MAG: 3-methyl-2-oxobutanoate hydroxymethyltransferase [Candidatus Muproteobacteria bacterium RBG_16_65_31]